eukprot:scaffold48_cov311-Pinguiococcus_pyrenoidosus.AAC.128
MCRDVPPCAAMCRDVPLCAAMCRDVPRCAAMCRDVPLRAEASAIECIRQSAHHVQPAGLDDGDLVGIGVAEAQHIPMPQIDDEVVPNHLPVGRRLFLPRPQIAL